MRRIIEPQIACRYNEIEDMGGEEIIEWLAEQTALSVLNLRSAVRGAEAPCARCADAVPVLGNGAPLHLRAGPALLL